MWSADQRGLRCEPTTRTIIGHAGWSQTITKIASLIAASRIKKTIRANVEKCFKSAELPMMVMMKRNGSEHFMIHPHYSTVNDGVKGLRWYRYDCNEVF